MSSAPPADESPPLHGARGPYRSFWMGGYEGADHVSGKGRALDMVSATGHLDRLDEDYEAAARLGLRSLRESVGWRLAEPTPGRHDFARARRMARAARRQGVQLLWTVMHYGTPADVSLFDDALIDRFARFAGALAAELAPGADDAEPPVYTLVNEIGFLAWAASETDWLQGGAGGRGGSAHSGYAVKRRLVRAVLAAIDAVRREDPRARFLHVEPLVHVAAPADRPELAARAREVAGYQWQAWDLIAGRLEPALGGSEAALDLIGANHYHSGQWEVETEHRLHWHLRDARRRPLADLLGDAARRYARPLILAETSHVGVGRAAWLDEMAAEVERARARGVAVEGLCLYPLIDRPDWNDASHWHHSGLWDVRHDGAAPEPPLARVLHEPYAEALAHWQTRLPGASDPSPGTAMAPPTLIVFSHLRWGFVHQRPQHLLTRLARHYRVLFVEEPLFGDGAPRLERMACGTNLELLVPHTPVDAAGFHDRQLPLLKPLLADFLREHGVDDYLVWFYTPMALPLIAQMRPRAVVYDCMDELSNFHAAPRQLRQRETALLKVAGLVLTGGPSLYAARRDRHPNVHCLPSAVEAEHFGPGRLDPRGAPALEARRLQGRLPRPRLGFFGVIDERLDRTLLARLADARPGWQIVMVGPVVKIDPGSLPRRPNLHWLGPQPYERLPALAAGWDVCLMPFALNDATRFISPTKTLEYLAAEKPVVSTAIDDVVALYGDVVRIARDAEDFVAGCDEALAESDRERGQRLVESTRLVAWSSWDRTAATVHELIEAELRKAPTPPAALRELAEQAAPAPADAAAAGDAERARTARLGRAGGAREVPCVVIGAGPTGLAAAYHLGQGAARGDTLLLERESTVGGWCRSVQQGGYTFDHAGHIMFSTDPDVLQLYDRLLGDNLHWQNREAWIYSKGVYTRYPFQGSLYGLPPQVLKECLIGAIEARFGPLKGGPDTRATPPGTPAHFEEFIHRVWGAGIAKHFAIPYNEKLWTVPLAEMETSWLGGRVPLPDLEQMIEGALEPAPAPMGPNARFGYPLRGGFQALMDGFLPLLNCELALGTGVLHVSPARRSLRLDDGRALRFESLVSTMPLPRLVEACGDEAPPEIRQAAKSLRHVAVRCVNLGVRLRPGETRLTDKHWIYYPEDPVFHRIFVQGNASPHCNAPGGFALTCEITYGPAKPLPCEGDALVERVVADCRRVGILGPDHAVELALQLDMPGAYVVYDHARAAHAARIREWFASFGVILAGRYSEWEYYNSDHAFVAGRRAAEQLRAGTARSGVKQAAG